MFLGLPDRVISSSLTFTKNVNTHHMVARSLSQINFTCKGCLCVMTARKKGERGRIDCQHLSWGCFLPNDISGYTSLTPCPPALRMECHFLNHSEPDQWLCNGRLLANLLAGSCAQFVHHLCSLPLKSMEISLTEFRSVWAWMGILLTLLNGEKNLSSFF